MRTLAILPVLFLFAFTTVVPFNDQQLPEQTGFEKYELINHAAVKLFSDPYSMQIGYNEVAHTLGTTWSTDGDYWISTQFNFETHTVRSLDKHDSFAGVALQPNVSYSYWFNAKRYVFYWPGSGTTCIITQVI